VRGENSAAVLSPCTTSSTSVASRSYKRVHTNAKKFVIMFVKVPCTMTNSKSMIHIAKVRYNLKLVHLKLHSYKQTIRVKLNCM
jgi:hypothetical protein